MVTDHPHGYLRYKLDDCRCYTCGLAYSQYREHRAKAITAGTWQPYVDAEPARQHVLQLKLASLGDRSIAQLAGVDRTQIWTLLHGRSGRGTPPPAEIRPKTAAAILSVEPTLQTLPGALQISAVGTHRRLHALGRQGWPQVHLAQRLGMSGSNYGTLLGQASVTARKARAVRVLYEQLWRLNPLECGVALSPYNRALTAARAKGWAPVGAWDDDTIDAPEAFPDWTGHCGTSNGYQKHYDLGVLPACESCKAARRADYAARQAAKAAA